MVHGPRLGGRGDQRVLWKTPSHPGLEPGPTWIDGFTKRYGVTRLVYAEPHDDIETAILQEKRLKRWRRAWKIALIEEANAEWRDLFDDLNA